MAYEIDNSRPNFDDQIHGFRGYKGQSLIKRPGVAISLTPEMEEEIARCMDDPIYFIETYMKIVDPDGNEVHFKMHDFQKEIVRSYHENRNTIVATCRQAGKALPLDTKIPTPNGWTTMGELRAGDKIFDEHGRPVEVEAVSKIFNNHDCYRITFDDKTSVIADANHIWTVYRCSHPNKKSLDLTTEQMFNEGVVKIDKRGRANTKWRIPLTRAVQYPSTSVQIDPYTLGAWLGDGNTDGGRFTCSVDDLAHFQQQLKYPLSHNYYQNYKSGETVYHGTAAGLQADLRKIGVIDDKRIPIEYLQNDVATRLAVLQGLMDTDGTVEPDGRNCIALTLNRNPRLVDDVYQLLVSLGFKVFRKHFAKTNHVRMYFHCDRQRMEVFRLPRKLNKQKAESKVPTYSYSRMIRSIDKVESVPTKCISVNSPSHLYLCSEHFIPTHNTTSTVGFILWYVNFHPTKNVAILANKLEVAVEILDRVQFAFEGLPKWLQQGVIKWNNRSVVLENKSKIRAAACSKTAIRGFSVNFLFIDEVAHVEKWQEFFTSSAETISSGKETKIALVSTPNGLNHFYEIFTNAQKKKNGYNHIKVTWQQVPGRDEKWKQEALGRLNFDMEKFRQEHEVEFLGSSGTLISGFKLQQLHEGFLTPIYQADGLTKFFDPEAGHVYSVVADVSEGKGLDYSAFHVIDVTKIPYRQVCTYHSNMITPYDYAEIIYRVAKTYNEAYVLIETNNIGAQVAGIVYDDFGYENLLYTITKGKTKQISSGFGDKTLDRGIKTTKTVKSVGCSIAKLLIEQDKLLLHDPATVFELSTFSRKNKSFEAEEGKHDDLVMGLVLFSWLSDQTYFQHLNDINTLNKLREMDQARMDQSMLPFGFVSNGQQDPFEPEVNDVTAGGTESLWHWDRDSLV